MVYIRRVNSAVLATASRRMCRWESFERTNGLCEKEKEKDDEDTEEKLFAAVRGFHLAQVPVPGPLVGPAAMRPQKTREGKSKERQEGCV